MISVIVPTVRPQNIQKIKEAVIAEGMSVEFLWEEDKEQIGAPKMVKRLTDKTKHDLVCFIGDDTEPQPGFLQKALEMMQAKDAWLVGLNDTVSKKPTHWLASKKLLEHLENNEFFYTGYNHNRCDVELERKARDLGKYVWCEEAIVKHNHPHYKTAPMDQHYERGGMNQEKWAQDIALFKERNCKIAVAMIIKNESSCLEKCLESVKWADAIYIEDTGSKDNTVEIAKKYTDNVSYREWTDNFAEARNSVKEKVKEPWILSIDADEELETDEQTIRDIIFKNVMADSFGITMTDKIKCSFNFPRLLRNNKLVEWQGAIHNSVKAPNETKAPEIVIRYGYSEAHKQDPERAYRILSKEHAKDPTNARIMYYLGREMGYRKEYADAVEMMKKYVAVSMFKAEKADAYYLMATYLWHSGRGDEARDACLQAINLNANFKGAIKLMAQMSWPDNAKVWGAMAGSANNNNVLFIR